MDEAPVSPDARRDLRAVVDEVRDELGHAAKLQAVGDRVDRVAEKLDGLARETSQLRVDVQALVKVGESLALVGAWAMRWTPYIIAILAGANLLDLREILALLATRGAP